LSIEVYAREAFPNLHLAFEKVAELLNTQVIQVMYIDTQTSKLCVETGKKSKVRVRMHPKNLTGPQVRSVIETAMAVSLESLPTEFGVQYARDIGQLKDFKEQRAIEDGNMTPMQ
jgi:hypothetical protein